MKSIQIPSANRRGLTLIEVIVVMGILAMLAAFLMPSVPRSRESARRTQCKNHLKQLGVALHNYHDTFSRAFPPGYIYHTQSAVPKSGKGVPFSNGWGWQTMLLPYIDQAPLFDSLWDAPNMRGGLAAASPQQLVAAESVDSFISSLICPSDPGSQKVAGLPGNLALKPCGRTNYFGVVGSAFQYSNKTSKATSFCSNIASFDTLAVPPAVGSPIPGALGRCLAMEDDPFYSLATVPVALAQNYGGIFGANSKRGLADIADGMSNVIMVGERYTPMNSDPLKKTVVGDGIWAGVSALSAEYNALGEATYRINTIYSPDNRRPPTTGFGSLHIGGAQFLMADGAVKFLSEKLDITTYRNLSRIDDGNFLGDF